MEDTIQTDVHEVTIDIPAENVVQTATTELPQDELQEVTVMRTDPDTGNQVTEKYHVNVPTTHVNIPTTAIAPKHAGGRPCEYCKRPEEVNKISREYLESAREARKGKRAFIPYQQELADLLDIDNDTLYQWTIKKKGETEELEHPEFTGLVKKLNTLKELLLLQRTTGRYNPTGAIFQLKTKHGYIETEKQVLTGDKNEPVEIKIIEERPMSDE